MCRHILLYHTQVLFVKSEIMIPTASRISAAKVWLPTPAIMLRHLFTGMRTRIAVLSPTAAAIFAAKYGSDAPFAARNVVFTTLLSMLTLPLWAYAVG